MDIDRVVADVERLILRPDQPVRDRRDHAGGTSFMAGNHTFVDVTEADWAVSSQEWVDAVIRVVMTTDISHNNVYTYGLVYGGGDAPLYLNDRSAMRELGGRVRDTLTPAAYMELLSELYSGRLADEARVLASSVSESHRPGILISDLAVFAEDFPWVDPSGLTPPSVHSADGRVVMEFFSSRYYVSEILGGVDVLRWRVLAGGGQPATWEREYVIKGAEGLWPPSRSS